MNDQKNCSKDQNQILMEHYDEKKKSRLRAFARTRAKKYNSFVDSK